MDDIKTLLISKLKQMRSQSDSGEINIDNFNDIIDNIIEIIKAHLISSGQISIYEDLKKIAKNIRATKEEVSGIDIHKMEVELPNATSQLRSVNNSTLNSSETIMDATENIQKLATNLDNQEIKKSILDHCCRIMEACSFHDLTSQRISKVIDIFEDIEKILYHMMKTFQNNKTKVDKSISLLNGPQIEGAAPSQQEIDDLFNSL